MVILRALSVMSGRCRPAGEKVSEGLDVDLSWGLTCDKNKCNKNNVCHIEKFIIPLANKAVGSEEDQYHRDTRGISRVLSTLKQDIHCVEGEQGVYIYAAKH
jgi:hypothetical protein